MEREDEPPTRYYVKYEDRRLIAAARKRFGADWRDEILAHDEIMSVRNFADLDAARAFKQSIAATDHYAEIHERLYLQWVADLRQWQCEGEVIE